MWSGQMDVKTVYNNAMPYLVYCQYSNEKAKLQDHIRHTFPDVPQKQPQRILDIGSGNGINTAFLADYFPEALLDALEQSEAQLAFATTHNSRKNIRYRHSSFEQFDTTTAYDFILASHVLQYIDSDPASFIEKAVSLLKLNGECWFVQQTKQGMAEIIDYQKQYLIPNLFRNWKTFEDYQKTIEDYLKKIDRYELHIDYLDTSIEQIDFAHLSEGDKHRLEFIFCLEKPFDNQSPAFKAHLAQLVLGENSRISHPNGIAKLRRIK